MSFFKAEHLCAGYGGKGIVCDISFALERGCILGMLGANGCGKTTLLKSICGILPHKGSCRLDGTALEGLSARKIAALCSYIPQRSGISIDISALDVVLMGFNPHLGLLERADGAMRREALRALGLVGLAGKENENYMHLSEGQKQLCILARTFVSGAKLFLLDEPESALDFRYRYHTMELLRGMIRQENRSAIVALHDPNLALNFCDRLLIMGEDGTAECLCPADEPIGLLEERLCMLYGCISLQRCRSRSGREQLVMLKEDTP